MPQVTLYADSQMVCNNDAAYQEHIDNALKDVHTMLPGIINSYDPGTQSASVQPAIKRIFSGRGAVPLPLCVDVPVLFPGGGGYHLTFPVKPGDNCILIFSERCIDRWYVSGGVQAPAEYRLHDLSDAVAIVGINPLSAKLPNVQTDGAELRTRSRNVYAKLTDNDMTITCGGNHVKVSSDGIHIRGNLLIDGTGGSETVEISGNINHRNGTITSEGRNIGSSHTHNETGSVTLGPNP